jgi:hypothetical protein
MSKVVVKTSKRYMHIRRPRQVPTRPSSDEELTWQQVYTQQFRGLSFQEMHDRRNHMRAGLAALYSDEYSCKHSYAELLGLTTKQQDRAQVEYYRQMRVLTDVINEYPDRHLSRVDGLTIISVLLRVKVRKPPVSLDECLLYFNANKDKEWFRDLHKPLYYPHAMTALTDSEFAETFYHASTNAPTLLADV